MRHCHEGMRHSALLFAEVGAEEIEFDLWLTADGEIVSCHDDRLDRVSDGSGLIYEHTLAELQTLIAIAVKHWN